MNLLIDYGGGGSISLTRVQWGNQYTLDYGLRSSVSRGGTQNQFKQVGQPQSEIRRYSMLSLRLATIDSLRTLITANLGQQATVTDALETYQGLLSDDMIEIVTQRDDYAYDVELNVLWLDPVLLSNRLRLEDDISVLLLEDAGYMLLEST